MAIYTCRSCQSRNEDGGRGIHYQLVATAFTILGIVAFVTLVVWIHWQEMTHTGGVIPARPEFLELMQFQFEHVIPVALARGSVQPNGVFPAAMVEAASYGEFAQRSMRRRDQQMTPKLVIRHGLNTNHLNTTRIERNIVIDAPPSEVWNALTDPDSIRQWMGEPEMRIEVVTDWSVGSPILVTGFHHVEFRNMGTVLSFEPERNLRYTHLSSVSHLPDEPGSYTEIGFELTAVNSGTSLTLVAENFPTEVIFRHLDFYWRTTVELLKKFVERRHLQ